MTAVFNALGGKKYFLALLFYALSTTAFFLRWIPGSMWTGVLEWCLAIYLGANVLKGIPDSLARNGDDTEPNSKFFNWFGGRKMFLAFLFIITITVAFFIPTGDTPKFLLVREWIEGMEWCLIIYLGANAANAVPDWLGRRNGNGIAAGPVAPIDGKMIPNPPAAPVAPAATPPAVA